MLESKRLPREITLPLKPFKTKQNDCQKIYVAIQNETLNIKGITDEMWKLSQELREISTNGSFRAVLAGLGVAAIALIRLIGAIVVGRRTRGRIGSDQVVKESRKLLASVQKTLAAAKQMAAGDKKAENLVKRLEFQAEFLKQRQFKLQGLVDHQKRLGCLN